VFQEPAAEDGGPLYQFVPASESWEGHYAQVYDLLAALALIENRYAGDVLTDIMQRRGSCTTPANGPTAPTEATPSPR
jgi:hypothetical protein